jgi:subtilase family serine protease
MKIRHLLLGLMICVAGTGAIGLSGGFLDDQNTTQLTPFLIFGHVLYDGGAPCNSPNVSITNLNTGVAWYADTVSGSDFYQILLTLADVSAGDVLRWSATDGTVFGTANRTVGPSDLESGGIFDFGVILQSVAPRITGYAPESQIHDIENAARRFNVTIDQVVDVTWLVNSSPAQANESVTDASYTHTNVAIGVWNVSARASNENGTTVQGWVWNVTTLPPPKITSFAPPSPVRDTENATRTFGITVDQVVDVTWLINGTEVFNKNHVNESSYTNISAALGVWNVTAVASNQNGTDAQEWIWHVNPPSPPPLDGGVAAASSDSNVRQPVIICGWVLYENGSRCIGPLVNISNLNTGMQWQAQTHPDHYYYQLVLDSANVSAGDMVLIDASKNGTSVGDVTHTVNQAEIEQGAIEVDINKRYLPDFTVTNLTFDLPDQLMIGDLVMINATIANPGASEGKASVEFYDNKNITIKRILNDYLESPINDTIRLLDVKRIRVHFESFDVSSMGNITIYNETRLVERITRDGWTKWCDGDTIRIQSCNAGFTIDRYETVLADEPILVGAENSTNIPAVWNLSDQSMGWAVHGSHNITVRVDPHDQVIESNETNNEIIEVIDVHPSLDFAVTNMSLNPSEPVLGEVVGVSANIANYGVRNGTAVVGVYYDNRSIEIKRDININETTMKKMKNYTYTDNISLPSGVLGARLHFKNLYVVNGHVDICDNNGRVVERIGVEKNNYWTDCIYTDNITVRTVLLYITGMGTYKCNYIIDGYEALIAEEPVTLNATESKAIDASWLTGAAYGGAREHNITVMVDPRNHSVETNETNNTRSEEIFVNGTDLAVTEIEIPCGSSDNPCYVGQYVDITATIANIGTVDVTDFTVVFKDGACLNCSEENMNRSGVIFNETHIERLNSSENMTISVIWNPAEINNHTITARIPYEATDSNETNNELSDCSDVEARYDFSVERVNVGPPTAEKGESVNITATVGCTGYAGGNVSIAFFVNSTDFTGTLGERFTRIGTIDDVPLEVNETKTVSMRWDANVVGGYHLIAAVVNPENELEEINPPGGTKSLHDSIRFRGSDTGNNVKNCTLHVIPLDLNITDLTLVPSKPNIGDVVDVTTEIRNNGDVEANSTVWFYMERNESIAEKSSSEGSWQWRTALQPEVPMRFHFDYIEIYDYAQDAGGVNAYVTDGHDQKHPVYFYVKCGEKYGGQYAKTHGICLDTFGYESVIYLNCSWKRWNDVWTDWDNGTAFELDAGHNVRLSIDKYQVRLGNRTVTLSADESGLYDAEWNTSLPLKPGKNYTILANVENQRKESKETYLGGTDLVVTDLSVKPVVWDGEAVRVNATIENLGRMDAAAFTVNFTERYDSEEGSDYNTTPITKIDIEGLNSGNSTNISVLWNARIREIRFEGERYVWFEIADDYTIIVEIDPLENLDIKEEDSTNYSLERCVHVDYSRDFNVTDLSFSVNGTACDPPELDIYDDVTLNATVSITDILNQNGSVDVGFFIDEVSDEHKIGSYSITFDGGNGTGYAEIEWSVTCPPGDHDVIVMADPEEKIQEISETNNNLTQKIFVNAPELVLESLDVHPRDPERGEMVSINVTITNIGRRNTSDVTLCIYEWAERHIENLCEQSGPGREQIEITREDATAMRLYLDLEAEYGCKVCVSDGSGSGVICYDKNFHGWTPWIFDNSTTVVVTNTETKIASARVGKVYYIAPAPSSIIDTSVHDLGINETKNVMVNWSTSVIGEQFITAIVDPEDYVTEYNESNNRLAEFISVQTADLIVSNLSLTWINGTEISENDTIKHGDNVTITTDIANTGVEGAGNFSVRVLIGDILIKEETISGLANGSTIPLDTNWSATVGCHLINVEADWENEIDETNETNNIVAWGRHVSGAELSGDISWETLGLHGEILFGPTEPYDEDEVVITATINNSGSMPAANLSAAIFFDYTPFSFQKRCRHTNSTGEWINKTYPDAEYIYLNVTTPVYVTDGRCMIKDDVIVYDGNGSEVARPQKSCSVLVNGDTVDVNITPQGYSSEPVFDIYFYPIYQNETSKLFEAIDVPVNSSYNISMNRTVSVGNFTIMAVIDPGNKAPEDEDHRVDNVMSRMMSVKPTRDFTVTNVTAARTNLLDLDKTEITAEVSNIGLRNGTTNVSFVDCEGESRTYKYHFDANRTLSYLPIPPDATLSGFQYDASPVPDIYHAFKDYENLTIIHRPGMDAIVLHFDRIILKKPSMDGRIGVMSVRDENETEVWIKTYRSGYLADVDIRVPGETAYIHSCKASFVLDGYTAEKELLKEEVRLNSTKDTNESKNITSMWTAYTGDHTIAVTLDGDDRITEISESNNELSPLFHVNASRDPAIVELNINPENPMDGDDVDISAIIANNGSRNASFTFDLWANTTRNKNGADEPLPDANLITDLGDRIRYIRLLKHANLTLAPGENVIVNATWNDISVFGSPKHRIIAIVDPLDEIDEMNESNNEIDKEIIMAYPDLTVGRAYVHGGTGKPVVNIKEIGGISGASDVTVRFESYETVELYSNKGCGCIHHPGADNMQVYFEHIDARGGYVEVGGKRYSARDRLCLPDPPS